MPKITRALDTLGRTEFDQLIRDQHKVYLQFRGKEYLIKSAQSEYGLFFDRTQRQTAEFDAFYEAFEERIAIAPGLFTQNLDFRLAKKPVIRLWDIFGIVDKVSTMRRTWARCCDAIAGISTQELAEARVKRVNYSPIVSEIYNEIGSARARKIYSNLQDKQSLSGYRDLYQETYPAKCFDTAELIKESGTRKAIQKLESKLFCEGRNFIAEEIDKDVLSQLDESAARPGEFERGRPVFERRWLWNP
jgi:hypothetical protein